MSTTLVACGAPRPLTAGSSWPPAAIFFSISGNSWSYGLTTGEHKTAVWLKPVLVCQVRFTEWTMDGHLRHPAFQGSEWTSQRPKWCGSVLDRCYERPLPVSDRKAGPRSKTAPQPPRAIQMKSAK
jgi:ATP dependent DNA ligase-like protein